MEVTLCKYWDKKEKGFCKAANVKTSCKNNRWYCDWVTKRKEYEKNMEQDSQEK